MRKAKEVEIYNTIGDMFKQTVKEFCEDFELTETQRKRLYKKNGWIDEEGIAWKIGSVPQKTKTKMSKSKQSIYNMAEGELISAIASGNDKHYNNCWNIVQGIEADHIILAYQRKTNVHSWVNRDALCVCLNPDWIPAITAKHEKNGLIRYPAEDQAAWVVENIYKIWKM